MNTEGHRKKARELKESLAQLLPDPQGRHVVAITELTYGLVQHLIAIGMETKHGRHLDTHVGLPRELRMVEEPHIAELFLQLDSFRAGRWYGSKGNGNIVQRCQEIVTEIEEWAQL